jgi:hypothetical protein
MTQRVGEWKLEFAAAAPLSIHIHIAYGQLRRGSSLLGYVIKQWAAEKPSRILKRASEKRPSSVVSMASDIQDLPKNVTRCSFSSPSSAVDLALETSLMGNLGQGKICWSVLSQFLPYGPGVAFGTPTLSNAALPPAKWESSQLHR